VGRSAHDEAPRSLSVPPLRGNLHAHTLFSDGVKSPAELIAEYEARGYDFLAITDHEDLISDTYWRALRTLSSRLLLFQGVEISYQPFPQHVGRVIGDRETLYVLNHPARYRLSVAETIERMKILRKDGLAVDAVEVTDTGRYRPLYHSDEIPLTKIATDDAHKPVHFGRAWIDVEAPRDRDAIIRAIRAGNFTLGFNGPPSEE
jgi:predicted metal-dependent phosphoesterase TrpH